MTIYDVLGSEVDMDAHLTKKPKQPDQPPPQAAKKVAPKPSKKKAEIDELHSLAFGFKGKGQKKKQLTENGCKKKECQSSKKGTASKVVMVNGVDEDWQKRDEEFVRDENEKRLREALILSKLHYEEKEVNKPIEEDTADVQPRVKKEIKKARKRKEKPIVLALGAFNSIDTRQLGDVRERDGPKVGSFPTKKPPQPPVAAASDEKFFDEVDMVAKRLIETESKQEELKQLAEEIKNRPSQKAKEKDKVQISRYIAEVEKRDFEIQALRLEVEALKEELKQVKARNKKLCEVISQSEMRTKGELVVQLETVSKARDEYSEELTRLSAELEQEKTKVSSLVQELKKMPGRKRNAESSSKD